MLTCQLFSNVQLFGKENMRDETWHCKFYYTVMLFRKVTSCGHGGAELAPETSTGHMIILGNLIQSNSMEDSIISVICL